MRRTFLRSAALAGCLAIASACGGGGSPAPSGVTVTPSAPGVAVGQSQQFTATVPGIADQSVSWSVQEGTAGGSITPVGLYTAPALPGTFHVVATSLTDGARTGAATVYVVPPPACTLPSPQPSALPAAQVLELGVHAVNETVTFQVPPGTGSVTLLQQGAEPLAAQSITLNGALNPNTVVPATIHVNGTLFYDQNSAPPADPATWGSANGIGSMYFESSSPWTGTVTVPNTSNALEYVAANGGVPAGTWSVQVFDYAAGCTRPSCTIGNGTSTYPPGRYDLKALLKPGPVPATGTIDVNLYLVTDRFTKATAEASGAMTRMRQTLGTYFARAGVALGNVSFVDLPADVKARYASGVNIDGAAPCDDVSAVLRLAGPGNAMSLFLVNSLVSTQGGVYTLVGLDGTNPGPSSVGGTVASGALVSVADLAKATLPTSCQGAIDLSGCGADFTAYVAAHEAGHFLGLYHLTEQDGALFDPVKDTPKCALSTCAPGKTEVVVSDCTKAPATACGGGDNLMFWLLSRALSTGNLSPQQSSIVRANALVR
jgi:hypothetical protein